jgi:predicted dehydrogenase
MSPVRVAVVGVGYWGPNVVRALLAVPGCEVVEVCDTRSGRLDYVRTHFPDLRATSEFTDILDDESIGAVAIVTPVSTHRGLVSAALEAGKHVFVEKPLAASSEDAAAMVALAEQSGLVLATGHLFVHHPAVVHLRRATDAGELGRLCYARSDRVNLSPPASEVNVIWDLAVHDVSIMLSVLGAVPSEVLAEGRTPGSRASWRSAVVGSTPASGQATRRPRSCSTGRERYRRPSSIPLLR